MAAPPYGSGPPWAPGGVLPPGIPPSPPPIAAPAPRQIPYVNNYNSSFTTANVLTKILPLIAAAGNGVLVLTNGNTVSAVTDNLGNQYFQAAANTTSNGAFSAWYCPKLNGPNPQITVTQLSGAITVYAFEIVGGNPQFFIDQAATFATIGQSPITASFATSSPGDLIVTMEVATAGSTNTVAAGYTIHWQTTQATGNGRSTVAWSNASVAQNTFGPAWTNTGGAPAGVVSVAIRAANQFPDGSALRNVQLPVLPPGTRSIPPGSAAPWPPFFPEVVPAPQAPSVTQYYGEDAELLDQDDDEQVLTFDSIPASDNQLQYFGEDAELADQDDDDQVVVDSQPTLQGDAPIEDGWDWWPHEEDEYAISDDYAFIENLIPVEDAWDHWPTDDDEQIIGDDSIPRSDNQLQYFGEDAELLDQDDDDQVNVDEYRLVDSNPVINVEDPIDWTQDEDDYVVIDDYALIDNLIPAEDAWDHWVTEDDDQVLIDEFALISVPVTALQYYGEDAELADADQDDDEWMFRDTDVLGLTLAQTFDDSYDHWTTDDDDYLVIDETLSPPDALAFTDGWDHFVGEDDEQWSQDESQASILSSPTIDDSWEHFSTDDDDYYVDDNFVLISSGTVLMAGIALCGGLSVGIGFGVTPVAFQLFDPRFFNGSNAWLGYRTSSGGGLW